MPAGDRPKVIILGSGPNRIGQGIEFDYACVHASFALAAAGYETVMVNCNPETVSTDYDTSGRLYFEPLTLEDVLEVLHAEQASGPVAGVIVQLGGQTPLGLARGAGRRGRAGGRDQPGGDPPGRGPGGVRRAAGRRRADRAQARHRAPRSARPRRSPPRSATRCWCGPPTCSAAAAWRSSTTTPRWRPTCAGPTEASPEHPVLIDRFLDDAIEIDVDALYDGEELYLGGVMEHIEEAGIHSGDSACALPPITLGHEYIDLIRESTEAIARGVGVRGLLNVQYALAAGVLYVLEANPRASRTVPFVSKATAVPLAKAAARIMLGATVAGPAGRGHAARGGRRRHAAAGRADRGQGGGAAVRPVPRRRGRGRGHRARPGDALDRRGHGHRRGVRHRVREVPGGRLRAAAGQGPGVRLGGEQGQALDDLPGQAPRRPGLRDLGDRGNRGGAAAQRSPCHDRA